VLEEQLSYWKQRLSGLTTLQLPLDHPRPPVQSFRGAVHRFGFSKELSDALHGLSRRAGVTLFVTLLAAFNVLLYRYTGQKDIVVGSPIANRNRAEIEGIIGFFVNTLVLRTLLEDRTSFWELLRRVREVALGAYTHQDLPFERLVEELHPERDLSRTPLAQVIFALQNAPAPLLAVKDLDVQFIEMDVEAVRFDLELHVWETPERIEGFVTYNTDLFERATIERLVEHFRVLLAGVVADPQLPLSDLPLLRQEEQHQLLVTWNDTGFDYPRQTCFHHLFEDQAHRSPDAIAVTCDGEHLTYRELNQRANQLAHYLHTRDVGPEVRVGVCVERSLEMVVGLLGAIKAGSAYVPLDPTYPGKRLAFMLRDSRVPVVLTQSRLLDALADVDAHIVCLDADWATIERHNRETPAVDVFADNLVYAIYTSGSTGQPKSVGISHAGLVNLVSWHRRVFELTPETRASQVAGLAFDAAGWEIWPYLAAGSSVHVLQDVRILPTALIKWLVDRAISVSFLPTPLAEVMLDERWPSDTSLRILLTGGDKLHQGPPRGLPFTLVNNYGPTEDSVVTTWTPITDAADAPPPIGRPVFNTQVYILDSHLNPTPVGVPGELCVSGDGLARGYIDRPGLTAEKFIPHPFGAEPGTRLYRTGDLARYRPDGNVEFLGRVDQQVKIRGYRIETGEIESMLDQHPSVQKSIILACEGPAGKPQLAAYVVPVGAHSPTADDLCRFLKQDLPDSMIPASFTQLETLPLTPNGKVDRRALPAPDWGELGAARAFVAPRTSAERTLADIWSELLKLETISVHDNFFELGGDSILSIQAISRANQAGLRLTPKDLFQRQTIHELAAVAGVAPTVQAEQGVVTGPVPLTPIQRWFFERDFPAPYHWNQAVFLQVEDSLSPALLEEAVRRLIAHHDALRLRFERAERGWRADNAGPASEVPFAWVDLSTLPEEIQMRGLERATSDVQASLCLEQGPVLRAAFLDLGKGRPRYFLLAIHHLVVDGVSWRILLEDLETACKQLGQGERVTLPPKTTSFKHWAERLTRYAESDAVRQDLAYWGDEARLHAAPLSTDEGTNLEAFGCTVSTVFTVEETRALLHKVPRAYHTQINDALLTALVQAFTRWIGVRSLLVDLEGHGREMLFDDVDLSRTVGWFTAMYPVLLDLEGVQAPGDALKTIKEQLRQVPRGGITYGLLRYLGGDAQIVGQLQAMPQAAVSFNYLGQFDQAIPSSPFRLAQESGGPVRDPRAERPHALQVGGSVIEDRLHVGWTYDTNTYRHETIEALARAFADSLRELISICLLPDAGGYTPSDFPDAGLDQDELEGILAEIGIDQ
jgi:amino acid adenylation domain-containing protein/non-ribosomal peptide synthase protein (TIGR01720 family)